MYEKSVIQEARDARPANPYSEYQIAKASKQIEIERRRASRSL